TIESVSRRARSVTLGALCLSLVGSGGYKIVTSDFWEGHDFHYDKKDYSLPVTSTAELGETIHPAFSSELVAAAGGGIADAPDLNDIYWDYKTNSIDDSSFTVDDGIRKITLTSSEKGHHCEIAPLEVDPPIGTKLSAWSSATHEDGTSRADEFDVTFTTESVLVCWNGEERNDEDDPLVYVRMIPPMK
ncbi:MAG TPA: hypothetical protein VK983_01045, partial [Candidatus Limnocylindrales bacterium]|nr:hypothetical protein [Candidatus Limnocylindrales bacterium]